MAAIRGLGASRAGRPTLGLQTIIDRLQGAKKVVRDKLSAVSLDDAEDAARTLERSRGAGRRFRNAAVVGGVMSPLVRGVGRAAEAAAMAPKGQRFRAAIHGVTPTGAAKDIKGLWGSNRGEIAKHVVEGGLGGAAVNAAREGVELGHAKRKAQAFLYGDKTAAQRKLASGLKRGVTALGSKIQPVPTSKLAPIVDGDYDFEV